MYKLWEHEKHEDPHQRKERYLSTKEQLMIDIEVANVHSDIQQT